MILDVDPTAGTVDLFDADVLNRFHIAVQGRHESDLDGVAETVASVGAGRLSGAEVLVGIDWLRGHGPASADWNAKFDAMVEYSASKGWVEQRPVDDRDSDGVDADSDKVASLRVHCEWPSEPKFAVLDFSRAAHREGRFAVGLDRYASADLTADFGDHEVSGRSQVLDHLLATTDPGGRYEIKHVVADGEFVAIHALATPVGAAGSGVVDLYQVLDGLITQWWRVG